MSHHQVCSRPRVPYLAERNVTDEHHAGALLAGSGVLGGGRRAVAKVDTRAQHARIGSGASRLRDDVREQHTAAENTHPVTDTRAMEQQPLHVEGNVESKVSIGFVIKTVSQCQ